MANSANHSEELAKKNLVIFILEGESDYYAMNMALSRLYNTIDENIKVEFIVTDGDFTTSTDVYQIEKTLKVHLENDRAVFDQLKLNPEKSIIIQVIDTDGVYIPEDCYAIDKDLLRKTGDKIKYEDKRILCLNSGHRNYTLDKHQLKRNYLNRVITQNKITIDEIEIPVSYSVYYISTNLEHFLPSNDRNMKTSKKENAKAFSKKYFGNVEGFVKYFTEDKNSATQKEMSYNESWNYIRKEGTTNSLDRSTNLDLLLNNLYLEGCLTNAINIFNHRKVYEHYIGKLTGLISIHKAIFDDISPEAGIITLKQTNELKLIEQMPEKDFDAITNKFIKMCLCHPFKYGNGLAIRIWYNIILREKISKIIDWSAIEKDKFLTAANKLPTNVQPLKKLLKAALTSKKNDDKIILDGLKQSFCFEGYDPKNAIRLS